LTVFQLELSRPRLRPALITASAALLGCALPGASLAAAPPPPESNATCYGSLTPGPSADEPHSLGYKFHCDKRITAYTILVNRGLSEFDTIDDFSTSAAVIEPDNATVDPTTSWSCEGTLPGDSLNCNTGGGTTYMGAWSYAEGTIDPIGPYCKYLPSGAKPGTLAKPGTPAEPRALAQLVVTDYTGAQSGPFRIYYSATCPAVPDSVPFPANGKRKRHQTSVKKGSK
jgi:hypothetical protein